MLGELLGELIGFIFSFIVSVILYPIGVVGQQAHAIFGGGGTYQHNARGAGWRVPWGVVLIVAMLVVGYLFGRGVGLLIGAGVVVVVAGLGWFNIFLEPDL